MRTAVIYHQCFNTIVFCNQVYFRYIIFSIHQQCILRLLSRKQFTSCKEHCRISISENERKSVKGMYLQFDCLGFNQHDNNTYELLGNKMANIYINLKSCPLHILICTTENCICWWYAIFSTDTNKRIKSSILLGKKKNIIPVYLIIKIAISFFERYFSDSIFTNHH